MNTLGNVVSTTNNIKFITPKGLAKQSIKATGKALIEEGKESELNINKGSEPLPGCSTSSTLATTKETQLDNEQTLDMTDIEKKSKMTDC